MKAWQCLLSSLQDFYCNADNTGQAGRTRRPLCSSASTASSLACSKGCSMGSMLRRMPLYIVHSASRLLICARSVSDRSCSCNGAAHQRRFCQREFSFSHPHEMGCTHCTSEAKVQEASQATYLQANRRNVDGGVANVEKVAHFPQGHHQRMVEIDLNLGHTLHNFTPADKRPVLLSHAIPLLCGVHSLLTFPIRLYTRASGFHLLKPGFRAQQPLESKGQFEAQFKDTRVSYAITVAKAASASRRTSLP